MAKTRQNSEMEAQPVAAYGLDGGMFRNVSSARIPENGCYDTENVVFYDGRVRPRPPFVQSVTYSAGTAQQCNHLSIWRQPGQEYLIRHEFTPGGPSQKIYYWDAAWNDLTVAGPLVGSATQPPYSTQFKGEWIVCPGADAVSSWAGSGQVVTLASRQSDATLRPPVDPYYITATASRVFLANGKVSSVRIPYRVWWSDTLSSIIWSDGSGQPAAGSAGYQDIAHDSSAITGLTFQGGVDVICFKEWSVYRGVFKGGPVWYDFVPISMNHGCPAGRTIKTFRNTLFWLGNDYNVYAMPLRGAITPVGDAVRARIKATLSFGYRNMAVASVDHELGLYYLIIPTGSTGPDKIFVLNLQTGAWAEGLVAGSLKIHCTFEIMPSYALAQQLFGGSDGKIYYFTNTYTRLADGMTDTAGAGGTAFQAKIWGKTLDFLELFKQQGETAEFHCLGLQGESGKATPQCRIGESIKELLAASSLTYDEVNLDSSPVNYSANRTEFARYGQLGIKWTSGQSSPMAADGITAWIKPRADVR